MKACNPTDRHKDCTVKSAVRKLFSKVIGHFDYELKITGTPLRSSPEFFSWLIGEGFEPLTIFDVGVANGTPWLYEAFPRSYFVLCEANSDFEPKLVEICSTLRGEYHIFCAGSHSAQGVLRINENFKSSSGLLPISQEHQDRLNKSLVSVRERTKNVDIRPLDELLNSNMKPPFLVKLDVEGYEIEALKGATSIIEKTDLLISEISVVQRHENGPRFAEFISYLDGVGFDLFDIIDMSQLKRGGRVTYLDAAFIRRGSFLENL